MNTSNTNNNESSLNKRSSNKIELDKMNKELLDTSNNQKRKTDASEISQAKTIDKTDNKSPSRGEDRKSGVNLSEDKRNLSVSPNTSGKRMRGKSGIAVGGSGKKSTKSVVFKDKNFLDIVNVESYKKYNVDMSYNEPEHEETTRCKCFIY